MAPKDLKHIGTKEHSGRYPFGSGEDPEQRGRTFLGTVKLLKKQGLSEVEIAKGVGMNTKQLREVKSNEIAARTRENQAHAAKLRDTGMSLAAIGREMGVSDHTVKDWLNPVLQERADKKRIIADMLKKEVDKGKQLDVGVGVETNLGVHRTALDAAIRLLKDEGYETHEFKTEQLGMPGKRTIWKVLTAPGTTKREAWDRRFETDFISMYSTNKGEDWHELPPPVSISSKRIKIRYGDEGGSAKDGVIELRKGVPDIALNANKRYSQVRIAVDDSHYMKGMAMYGEKLPEGIDIIYNTNKKTGTDPYAEKGGVYKPFEKDAKTGEVSSLPFKSVTRPKFYTDPVDGKQKQSVVNLINEEGEWDDWSRNISSQVLSKQKPALAKKQLGEAYDSRKMEYDEIMSLTNPAVKKKLLEDFADGCDSSSVHLKAAALPRQNQKVILPFNSIKENEVYAPSYNDAEPVVLIRHPHGGTFEIPELIVNNKNPEAKRLLGDSKDAIGINPKVAAKLSGADFDGDTVIVIPNKEGYIQTRAAIEKITGFNNKEDYKGYDGMPKMTDKQLQTQMGNVSNLITDMTIKGATLDEIIPAVRHSMVVIDAKKHNLDYKRSEKEHGIPALKKLYQGKSNGGASTLISKAKSDYRIDHRLDYVIDPKTAHVDPETGKMKGKRLYINPETGEKLHSPPTGQTYIKPGKKDTQGNNITPDVAKPKMIISTRMAETSDAFTLSSGTTMEAIYAEHANRLKALANKARKETLSIVGTPHDKAASETYSEEVKSLNAKLALAYMNKPLERQAQLLANKNVMIRRQSNPNIEAKDIKKIKGRELTTARIRVGAEKKPVDINDREWEAIQAGALSSNALEKILLNTKMDLVKERAMPRSYVAMSPAKIERAKAMKLNNCTPAEIANTLGVSVSTLNKALE